MILSKRELATLFYVGRKLELIAYERTKSYSDWEAVRFYHKKLDIAWRLHDESRGVQS